MNELLVEGYRIFKDKDDELKITFLKDDTTISLHSLDIEMVGISKKMNQDQFWTVSILTSLAITRLQEGFSDKLELLSLYFKSYSDASAASTFLGAFCFD